jgi:hypothetical protein
MQSKKYENPKKLSFNDSVEYKDKKHENSSKDSLLSKYTSQLNSSKSRYDEDDDRSTNDRYSKHSSKYESNSPTSSRSPSRDDARDRRRRKSDENANKNLKEIEFGWKQPETLGSVPPSDYTITNINQNHDLTVFSQFFRLF